MGRRPQWVLVDEREFADTLRGHAYLDEWDLDHTSIYDEDEAADGFFGVFDENRDDRLDAAEWDVATRDFDWAGL